MSAAENLADPPEPPARKSNLRRAARREIEWRADCRLRNGRLMGVILDISAHGAFFAPDEPSNPELLAAQLALAEKVALRFNESSLSDLELPARIRWIGFSSQHQRVGFGVEFSHLPMR